MGMVYATLKQVDRALECYEQALPIRREVGDRAGEATTLNNIGLVYDNTGQPQQALDLYERALPIRREVGDRAGEAVTCFNIGMLLRQAFGRTVEAISYLERCVQIDAEIGHPDLESDRAKLEELRRIAAGGA
jgi:tetratricopeptide (TPR) repeat protein